MARDYDTRETRSLRREGIAKRSQQVVVAIDEGRLTVETIAHTLEQVRAFARPYAPKGRLASDELIAERHAEALREEVSAAPSSRQHNLPAR